MHIQFYQLSSRYHHQYFFLSNKVFILLFSSSPLCLFDWNFTTGEQVLIISFGKQGFVSTTHKAFVKMDLFIREEITNVPWFDLCKKINVGDFVEVKGGLYQG
jgi:hypothetical protein